MLSLVLPTYNEAENLPELIPKLEEALKDIDHEIIIVDDDSPDGTWKVGLALTEAYSHLKVIRRIHRRGLSSAVIEGFLAAKGDTLAVMDADGQHDVQVVSKLHAAIQNGADIALGSRYTEGGSIGEWDERRHRLSRTATQMATWLCRVRVTDPMSGFFAIKRSLLEQVVAHLNPKGFKILLDILVRVPSDTKVEEVPFTFAPRLHGESKLSKQVLCECLEHLYDVTIGHVIPLTFIKYSIVGFIGVFIHLCTFMAMVSWLGADHVTYGLSTPVLGAIEGAILFNFLLNNEWTFAPLKLRGGDAIVGFLKFNVACLFGALANYSIYFYLSTTGGMLPFMSTAAGAVVGAVWNYTMSRFMTWKG